MKVFARAVTRVRGIDIYFFDVTRYAVTRVADRRSEVLRWGRKFILCQSPEKEEKKPAGTAGNRRERSARGEINNGSTSFVIFFGYFGYTFLMRALCALCV